MTKTQKIVAQVKDIMTPKPKKSIVRKLLSTGSTVLNLHLSNTANGGFLAGRYYLLVGDTSSGKTFFSMTYFAEALRSPLFREHRLIYDDIEGGNLFDLEKLFGDELLDRIETPPSMSSTVESFYYNVFDVIQEGKPFIYILDSMDGLTSESELEKFGKNKEAYESGKDSSGSYGDGKAKTNSANLRQIVQAIKDTDSILIIINQTRDNLGFGFKQKIRSGGHALEFYATGSIWTSVKGQLKKTVNGKEKQIGATIGITIEKNRLTGQLGKLSIPLYPEYGFDDISSCVQFLVEDGYWKKTGTKVNAPEFELVGSLDKVVRKIEESGQEQELVKLVESVWIKNKEEAALKRKPKYGVSDEQEEN